ncbi:MAG: NAD(P)/FAD-dependent oxidoreductase [Candidatus Thorarchaeota archaeon]|nr:NAD(P)/FAD-dependent oxidoreductase [Candidatus Thorarchaeota archaeon]
MKRVDVLVVGAGSAGCVTARRCAELGLKTLILEKKPQDLIGRKVCGDEISKSHFDDTGINYPANGEVSSVVSGADVYPPSLTHELKVRGWDDFNGWTVDRLSFGQRLLSEALAAGVMLMTEYRVGEPILRGEQVTGVRYKDLKSKQEDTIAAKIVVDASGFAATIRNKLDSEFVEKHVDKEDVALCYREIVKLRYPMAEPEVASVFLGGKYAPGGYAWIFPKGPQSVNVGVGIGGGGGRGSPKALYDSFKEEYPLLYDCEVLDSGGGAVPVRRPLASLVGNGVAFVGDAALQANPIHGGGLGPGMRAGIILGEVAKEAIARRDYTVNGLWDYNVRFLRGFGRRLASLEIFRRLLQQVTDEEMNFGFEKRLLEAGDLMAANRGDGIPLSLADKMRRVKRSITKPSLLRSLQKAASLMKKMNRIYARYPTSPSGFKQWNESVLAIVQSAEFRKK